MVENINLCKKSSNLSSDFEIHSKENSKLIIYKKKLETMVKDLQNTNKQLFEDAQKIENEEKVKREEIQSKFNKSIQEIQEKVKVQSAE